MKEWLIERKPQREMSNVWRKVINMLIEVPSKGEVQQTGGELVDYLIEVISKKEVSEGGWEVVYREIEQRCVIKNKVSKFGRQVI